MIATTADRADEPFRRVYHLSLVRLLIFPIIWVIGVTFCICLVYSRGEAFTPHANRVLLFLVGIITAFVLPFFGLIWQSRLVLTPQGIAHHQFGYTVRSAWANLESLSLDRGKQRLILAKPGTRNRLLRISSEILDAIPVSRDFTGDSTAFAEGRLITIAPFMSHWKRGRLREDLRQLAPQLFDANGRPRVTR
jgi:hypothetical protein